MVNGIPLLYVCVCVSRVTGRYIAISVIACGVLSGVCFGACFPGRRGHCEILKVSVYICTVDRYSCAPIVFYKTCTEVILRWEAASLQVHITRPFIALFTLLIVVNHSYRGTRKKTDAVAYRCSLIKCNYMEIYLNGI